VGWRNPAKSWSELEAQLSAVSGSPGRATQRGPSPPGVDPDKPATRGDDHEPRQRGGVRGRPRPGGAGRRRPGTAYAELHAHSHFSFLDGASSPEELVDEAVALELDALALTDHNGFYGVVRFAEAAREAGLPTVFGAEVSIGAAEPRAGEGTSHDPAARHLVILARDPEGYARLGTLLSTAQMAGEKGRPRLSFAELAEAAGRARGHWAALTGCRKGTVPAALVADGPRAAARELRALTAAFGSDSVFAELWDHGDPLDSARNDALVRLAASAGVRPLATNNVHYATPAARRLAGAMAAIRARSSLDHSDGFLPANGGAHLRSGAEQLARFARYPGVVQAASALGRECAFDLSLVAPSLPPYPCPPGPDGTPVSEMAYLRSLVEDGAVVRYGTRRAETAPGAWAQIDHELGVIEQLGFPGYFLVVWDIVAFCRRNDIYCQGRGSAANSAACFALGVTKADAVRTGAAVRALPVARARRPARHRPRHRVGSPGGGDPVRLRAPRPQPRRPGGQRDHLPWPLGGARHGQGAGLLGGPAGRLEPRSWAGGGRCPSRGRVVPRASAPRTRCMDLAGQIRARPGTWASTRAAW
jgi:error-prone DNA polymerase